jgi:hypothetical protein
VSVSQLSHSDPNNAAIEFTNNPVLISVRNRVPWRTAMICLILSRFRGHQATMSHLHILTWSVDTDGTRALFKVWLSGARPMDRSTVRIDPDLNVTVTLAYGLGLIDVIGSTHKVKLTEKGEALVDEIDANEELLAVEKHYLAELGSLNESRLQKTLGALAE